MKASFQKKKGFVYVVISYKTLDGKYATKWESTGMKVGTGIRKLEEKRKEILSEFEASYYKALYANTTDKNRFYSSSKCTFTEYLDTWLDTVRPAVALTTYKGYQKNVRRIKRYFEPLKLRLGEVKPIHIQDFYKYLSEDGLCANSIIHIHATIRKALQHAVKTELLDSNPADKTDRPRIQKYQASFYNKDELDKLFEVFKGDRMELCVHIAAYYGLRRSEVIGLRWEAVDFENKTITINHKIVNDYRDGKEVIIAEDKLKNQSSNRTLPLIPHIEELLLKEKEKQQYYSALLMTGYNHSYDEYICRDNTGELITPNYVTDHFRFMIAKHGLKPLRFHDLRHSCASLLLANGISMKQIQEWLGHSTYNVTANFYSHLEYNSKIASADAISKALG
ncbi:MAG: site-specific integrase [Oscillospiraceae bacterium]|nr:site-specific integrase [Oscillospiraceae bacterium]